MSTPIQTGPVPADQQIDPSDPDRVGNIAKATGAGLDALDIIQANAAIHEKMTPLLSLPEDTERTQLIDYDELRSVLDKDEVQLEDGGARVRGQSERTRVVTYIETFPSGRTGRGAVPYAKLPGSIKRYEDKKAQDLEAARAAKAAGGSEEQYGEDPRVRTLQERLDQLERDSKAAEQRAADAEARATEAEARAKDPEPYEGYAEANVKEIKARIEGVEDLVAREALKSSIRTYESAHQARAGVISATEPTALISPNAPEAPKE